MIPWKHILDEQPKHDDRIIQIYLPLEDGHCTMGMSKFFGLGSWDDFLELMKDNLPDYYWVHVEDFPFPVFEKDKTPVKMEKGDAS